MKNYKTMDANEAVSHVAYKFSELCGIYPITPASPMAEKIDVLSNENILNFWNNQVKVIEMQSEAGAVALVHGALQSGVLSSTFTIPSLIPFASAAGGFIAKELLPTIFSVTV